ncbi:MGMT family protein [Candidatus Nomurabacteria bacterium]|nr:MGMT family protein [Candidatus Nomurabacteria bacterium]
MKDFSSRVRDIVRRIPRGQVLTYKQVAILAGSPQASRAVGNIMKGNYDKDVPCHRVIRSDGKTGGYNGGESKKRELLLGEGFQERGLSGF